MTLVAYYPLSDASAPFTDYVQGNNASNGGLTPGATGILGTNAVSGSNGDYAEVNDALVYGGSRSVSVWFYPTEDETWYINNSVPTASVFDFEEAETTSGSFMLTPRNNEISDRIGLHFWANNLDTGLYLSDIGINQWHHFLAVHDSSINEQRLYINGVLEGTSNYTLSIPTSGKFQINRRQYSTTSYEVLGRTADMRVYNHPMGRMEAQYLYNVANRGRQVSTAKTL